MSRTITILDLRKDDQSNVVRSNFLFDYFLFREALVKETLYVPEPPPKEHWLYRYISGILDGVFDLVNFLKTTILFSRPSPAEKKWLQEVREKEKRETERISPASLLRWLDEQTGEHIEIDGRNWNLRWAYELVTPGPPFYHSQDDEVATLTYVKAYCHECRLSYPPAQIELQHWGYDHGPLASGGGRNLCCPQKHILLKILDWRS